MGIGVFPKDGLPGDCHRGRSSRSEMLNKSTSTFLAWSPSVVIPNLQFYFRGISNWSTKLWPSHSVLIERRGSILVQLCMQIESHAQCPRFLIRLNPNDEPKTFLCEVRLSQLSRGQTGRAERLHKGKRYLVEGSLEKECH